MVRGTGRGLGTDLRGCPPSGVRIAEAAATRQTQAALQAFRLVPLNVWAPDCTALHLQIPLGTRLCTDPTAVA